MQKKESWINRLERKFGKYAIHNLMLYIIVLYVIGAALEFISYLNVMNFYLQYLCLDVSKILQGQVWRLLTFVMQPPSENPFFLLIMLYLYYMIGVQLERTWGAFRFNLYFFFGVLFHILAAFIVYALTGLSLYMMGTEYLILSLFLAFAMEFSEVEFLLFFLIPIKAKYLAMLDGVYFVVTIVGGFAATINGSANTIVGSLVAALGRYIPINLTRAVAALASLVTFLLFYLSTRKTSPYNPKQVVRKRRFKQKVRQGQQPSYPGGAQHKCAVCGRTELDDPSLEFRFCSKCNGNYEYCQDHLFTHEHKR